MSDGIDALPLFAMRSKGVVAAEETARRVRIGEPGRNGSGLCIGLEAELEVGDQQRPSSAR